MTVCIGENLKMWEFDLLKQKHCRVCLIRYLKQRCPEILKNVSKIDQICCMFLFGMEPPLPTVFKMHVNKNKHYTQKTPIFGKDFYLV